MSSTTHKVFKCDRCGEEATSEASTAPAEWGRIAAEKSGGSARIGHCDNGFDDLCGSCLSGLFAWFSDPRNLAALPAPEPARFDENARKVAETRAAAVLNEQLGVALTSIKNQPTSILTGEWPEGARSGIEERAKALIDSILDQLKIARPRRRKALAA